MPVPDFAHGIQTSFLATATEARLKAKADALASANPAGSAKPTTEASKDDGLSFDDLLDVVNPLQHFPIVSTLYRHYAHDEIKPLPKIAGDALYGGLPGLISSVADFAFEKITGKNFGDTVLAMITGDDDKTTAVAANTASSPTQKPSAVAAKSLATPSVKPVVVADAAATPAPMQSATAATPATAAPLPLAKTPNSIPTLTQDQLDALMASINQKGIDPELSARAMDAYRRMNDPATTSTVQQLR
ncbi:MAG TPA: hypothetical protein VGM17_03185 [Rhizomicrobium sp.]|jgi:hypothetical protein